MAERRLNVRFVLIESAIILGLAVLLAAAHAYQLPRNATFLKTKAEQAVETGHLDEAIHFLRLYLGMRPDDQQAYTQLATLLVQLDTTEARYEAYEKLLQVLRREPDRDDLRKELIVLANGIGENRQALSQAQVLATRTEIPSDWWLPIARTYTLNDKLDLAVEAYQKYIAAHPEDLTAYREYVELELQTTRDKELLAQRIGEMLARNEQSAQAHLMAYVLRRDNKLPDAMEALDEAMRTAPDDVEVLLMAAGEAIRAGSQQAAGFLDRALKAHPDNLRVLLLYGRWAQGQGNLENAQEMFRRGFEASKRQSAEFAWRLADLLLNQSAADITPYMVVLRQNPLYHPVREYLAGRQAIFEGRLQDAAENFHRASSFLESRYNKSALGDTGVELEYALSLATSSLHFATGDLSQAIERAMHAKELFPGAAVPWMTLGLLYFQAARYDESLESWRQAVARPPVPPQAYFEVARCQLYEEVRQLDREPDFSAFETAYDTALRRIPNSQDLVALRAEYLLDTGNYDEAMTILQAGFQAHPRDHQVALSLLRGYLWIGRFEEGAQLARQIRRTIGVNAPLAVTEAQLLLKQGKADEAEKLLARLVKLLPEPQQPAVLLAQGNLAWLQGHPEQALTIYQQAVELAPDLELTQVTLFNFLLETSQWEKAEALLESWRASGDDAMSQWGQFILHVVQQGLDKIPVKQMRATHDELVRERPFWWGTAEIAGLLAEANGSRDRARQWYVTAAWTGPAFPYLLRRLPPLLKSPLNENAKVLLKTSMDRRVTTPPDAQFAQLVETDK